MDRKVVPFLDLSAAVRAQRSAIDSAIARVLDSGWFVRGSECEGFEREFAAVVGVAGCVGVGNGLDALSLGLRAYGVGPGDEVIVPGHTFIATWLAVSAVGAKPVPVDVDSTGNIDANLIGEALTDRTRAIIPVHLYGQPCDMTSIMSVARTAGLLVIEDAAQAHLARWDNVIVGGFGDGAAFSFYPGKNLGALGDAGAFVTSDQTVAERVRALANYGSHQKYVHDEAGVNSRLDEVQAAILRTRLEFLEAETARRRQIAGRYLEAARVLGLTTPEVSSRSDHAWHLFTVLVQRRDEFRTALERRGVMTQIHYPQTPGESGAYSHSYGHLRMPQSERFAAETVSLPMSGYLSDEQADRVVEALASVCEVGW